MRLRPSAALSAAPIHALLLLGVAGLSTSCATPLANRTAHVVPVGQAEMAVSAQALGGVGLDYSIPYLPTGVLPAVELNGRFGVADHTDVQLRLDTLLFPEFAVGYQFIGDATDHEFAAAVAVGGRFFVPLALGASSAQANISVPLQLLVDVPLGDVMLTVVSRNIVGVLTGQGGSLSITPGLAVSATIPIGEAIFLRPEFGVNYPILLVGDANLSPDPGVIYYGGALGIGTVFGDPR